MKEVLSSFTFTQFVSHINSKSFTARFENFFFVFCEIHCEKVQRDTCSMGSFKISTS